MQSSLLGPVILIGHISEASSGIGNVAVSRGQHRTDNLSIFIASHPKHIFTLVILTHKSFSGMKQAFVLAD